MNRIFNRRSFLGGLFSLIFLGACSRTSENERSTTPVKLGPLDSFPLGVTTLSVLRVAVVRDKHGLACISAVCTHQTCALKISARERIREIQCPCHGSTFDAKGEVTKGPATQRLPWYRLHTDESGNLWFTRSEEVSADWRLVI